MSVEILEKKLAKSEKKVELLEKMIEEKSRKLFVTQEETKSMAHFATFNPFPVVRIDNDGVILMSNMAANKYLSQEKLRGRMWNEFVDMNQATIDMSQGYLQHEYTIEGKVLLFCYQHVREMNFINIYAFDITQRKQVETELEEERARHLHSAKMATLGDMAGGIAHELNTPLGLIRLSIDQINNCTKEDKKEDVFEILDNMTKTVERMSRLINGFKTYSRQSESSEFSFISSKQLLEESLEICQLSLRDSGVNFSLPTQIPDEQIECNPTEISQVIVNLVQNSRDAISEYPNRWIKVETEIEENLIIKVTDSGDGIAEDILEKLFVPFFTTKEIGKGTGLGLSIIKGIVDGHKGDIFVDSKVDNTCFVVQIPIIQDIGGFL